MNNSFFLKLLFTSLLTLFLHLELLNAQIESYTFPEGRPATNLSAIPLGYASATISFFVVNISKKELNDIGITRKSIITALQFSKTGTGINSTFSNQSVYFYAV